MTGWRSPAISDWRSLGMTGCQGTCMSNSNRNRNRIGSARHRPLSAAIPVQLWRWP